MFEKAKEAGVQPTDLADVLGLHRVTVQQWYSGHAAPHHFIADRVTSALDTIAKLLASGVLPVPQGKHRGPRTRRLLRHHILGAPLEEADSQ